MVPRIKSLANTLGTIGNAYSGILFLVFVFSTALNVYSNFSGLGFLSKITIPVYLSVLLLILFGIQQRLSVATQSTPGSLNPGISIEQTRNKFEVLSKTRYRLTSTIKIRAKSDNVDSFWQQYGRVGTDPMTFNVTTPGYRAVGPLPLGIYEAYQIVFPKRLMKSDEACELTFQIQYEDPEMQELPYYAKWASDGCNDLTIEVTFPDHCSPEMKCVKSITNPATFIAISQPILEEIGRDRSIVWHIGKTRPDRKYVISWPPECLPG